MYEKQREMKGKWQLRVGESQIKCVDSIERNDKLSMFTQIWLYFRVTKFWSAFIAVHFIHILSYIFNILF